MDLFDEPLFEIDRDDIATMGQYKLHESKQNLIVMCSQSEYERHIATAVVDAYLAIMRAAVLSYLK